MGPKEYRREVEAAGLALLGLLGAVALAGSVVALPVTRARGRVLPEPVAAIITRTGSAQSQEAAAGPVVSVRLRRNLVGVRCKAAAEAAAEEATRALLGLAGLAAHGGAWRLAAAAREVRLVGLI